MKLYALSFPYYSTGQMHFEFSYSFASRFKNSPFFMLHKILSALLIFSFYAAHSQAQSSTVSGKIINDQTGAPIADATVVFNTSNALTAVTDSSGNFSISNVPFGNQSFSVSVNNIIAYSSTIEVNNANVNAGSIGVLATSDNYQGESIPTISLSESDMKESSDATIAGALGASRDAFINATSYTFGFARFQLRGYNNTEFNTYMNGAEISDLTDARTQYYLYGGLNKIGRAHV